MSDKKVKVIVADDHTLFLEGMVEILVGIDGIDVLGTAPNGVEALYLLGLQQADVLITDLNMDVMDGSKLALEVSKKYPQTKVLVVSMFNDAHVIDQLLKVGVMGYILKNTQKKHLLEAIREVSEGRTYFCDEVKSAFMNSKVNNPNKVEEYDGVRLTKREEEILKLIAAERTTHEIADQLFVSLSTVETHRKNILRKFKVRNSIGIVLKARELGLL